jgi:hypothetical protein
MATSVSFPYCSLAACNGYIGFFSIGGIILKISDFETFISEKIMEKYKKIEEVITTNWASPTSIGPSIDPYVTGLSLGC